MVYFEGIKKLFMFLWPHIYKNWLAIVIVSVVGIFLYNYYSMKAELVELRLKDEIAQLQQVVDNLKKEREKLKEKVVQLEKLKKFNIEENKKVNKDLKRKTPVELKKEADKYVKRLKVKRGL